MKKFFALTLAVLMSFSLAMAAEAGGDFIEVEGVVYPNGQNPNQMRRAVVMDAYRYLAEQTGDLYISSNTTVQQACVDDDEVKARVEKVVRGAKLISVTRDSEGAFHAIVRLYEHGGAGSLASAVLKEDVVVEDFPPPKFTNIVSSNYTGLIIDCRGKNLPKAIAPAIKSADGTTIYAYKNIGYQAAVSRGMISYSTSVDSGVERAGASPLTIKAVSISDGCDVVVSAQDADKILAANKSTNFLNNCAVVFVR